jgi:hypothetical protein
VRENWYPFKFLLMHDPLRTGHVSNLYTSTNEGAWWQSCLEILSKTDT